MSFLGGFLDSGSGGGFGGGSTYGLPGIPVPGGTSTSSSSPWWLPLVGVGVNAGTSILSGILASNAAGNAASTQAQAAQAAAALQYQASQNALGFAKQVYGDQQKQLQPWIQAGTGAVANLAYLLGIPMPQAAQVAAQNPQLAQAASVGGQNAVSGTPVGDATNPNGTVQAGLEGQGGFNQSLRNFQSYYGGARPVNADASVGGMQRPNATTGGPLQPGIMQDVPERQPGVISANTLSPSSSTVPDTSVPNSGTSGTANLSSLVNPSLGGFGSLMHPYGQTFTAPTNVTEQNDPGFQFRLAEGQKALERSAAAKGGLLNGGTSKALNAYAQDYASNEYQNVYNRALGEYQQNYNIFQQNQANQFNRLAALSGIGQTSAGQLNSAGQNYANNAGNLIIGGANAQAQGLNNAAAARASGYYQGANALTGTLGALGNLASLATGLKY